MVNYKEYENYKFIKKVTAGGTIDFSIYVNKVSRKLTEIKVQNDSGMKNPHEIVENIVKEHLGYLANVTEKALLNSCNPVNSDVCYFWIRTEDIDKWIDTISNIISRYKGEVTNKWAIAEYEEKWNDTVTKTILEYKW